MDDKKKFVLVKLSEAAQIIQTYPQLIEYAEEAAEIIQGPWTQELFDAAKQLPTTGGTADVVAISKEVELAGGTVVTGGMAISGDSSLGTYIGVGALTVVTATTAILGTASALGIAFDYIDGVPYYEAQPSAWEDIVDDIASWTFTDNTVPVIVTPDGKTYLQQDLVDAIKTSLYERGYFRPYSINPFVTQTGMQHFDLITLPYPLGGTVNLMPLIRTKAVNIFSEWSEQINTFIDYAWDTITNNIQDGIDLYFPVSITVTLQYLSPPERLAFKLSFRLLNIQQMNGLTNANIDVKYNDTNNYYWGRTQYNNYSTIFEVTGNYWFSTGEYDYNSPVSNYNVNNKDTALNFSDYRYVNPYTPNLISETVTGFGEAIKNIPNGVSILDNADLPTNQLVEDGYPSWVDNGIDVSTYNPSGEPEDQTRFIPVEMPIDIVTTGSNQKQSQGGEVRTIPQEIPLIVGQPGLNEIMNPSTPTPPSELPEPLTEPIPEIDPVSPTEEPEPPVEPETDPQPGWIPVPPFEPDPPTDPNPDPDSPPVPIPVPQPIPAPTNPPVPPVDDGTSPAIVLPPIDPNNGIGGVYKPSRSELRDLTRFLWSLAPVDQLKKFFQSPVEAIISLHQLYVTPSTGGDDNIYCGYIDTEVTAPVVTNQFVSLSCGSVAIPTKYNNALDYSPYTSVSIYLPFIGIRELNADDVIGSTITVTYNVDVLNGACLASVKCARNNLNAVIYTFEGNCAVQLPVTGATFGGPTAGLMVAGAAIVGTLATGGAAATAIATGAGGMMAGSKTHVQKSGNFVGNAGALGSKIPYIIVTRPIPVTPVNYHLYYGLPSHVSVLISSLTGYTRVKSVHIDDVSSATDEEKRMIESILKNGFIA